MLVFVHVSSMKTNREGSTRCWRLRQRVLWRFTSGRSCSFATSVFFERQAETAQEPAHQRGVGFNATLRLKTIAQRLQRYVGLLGVKRFDKVAMRLQLGAFVTAHLRRRANPCPL